MSGRLCSGCPQWTGTLCHHSAIERSRRAAETYIALLICAAYRQKESATRRATRQRDVAFLPPFGELRTAARMTMLNTHSGARSRPVAWGQRTHENDTRCAYGGRMRAMALPPNSA